jgi:RIO kinase 1
MRMKDKADRATVSQVLDERTRIIIRKMMVKGLFDEITGSISMGKEANVFRVEKNTHEGTQYFALKVRPTVIV